MHHEIYTNENDVINHVCEFVLDLKNWGIKHEHWLSKRDMID